MTEAPRVAPGEAKKIGSAARPDRDFTTWEAAARHRRERAFIKGELEAAHEAGLEAVVVTHHAPSPKSVHPRRGCPERGIRLPSRRGHAALAACTLDPRPCP